MIGQKYPCGEALIEYHPDMTIKELETLALQIRRDVVDLSNNSGTRAGHFGGEMSLADILAALYGRYLRLDPKDPGWEKRDRFVLSKGHNSGALYAALAFRGLFERELLFTQMNKIDGLLQEHSNTHVPGVEAPTGSLGMGLSCGCGMAWAGRQKFGADTYRVFVALGDGECNEGQVWESALCANQLGLDNLIAIVDLNKYVISGKVDDVMSIEPFADKWTAFGWQVLTANGNDMASITAALDEAIRPELAIGKPRVIIADTIKGWPIKLMMDDPIKWHSAHINDADYDAIMEELEQWAKTER